ncbi:hypothetical protein [Calderihabitans maritimus]|uniref:Uncharacterized protein n=1 Tax=Calderihabitans maritimus TaxID=1246530 RepID=A0A1Z5HST0_9FIRM|nr:hypothetical protein [Calderihabitans maritimus]GAW92574.1 hypothetical protein KKC1_17260 [Calderihabitans maritimus]
MDKKDNSTSIANADGCWKKSSRLSGVFSCQKTCKREQGWFRMKRRLILLGFVVLMSVFSAYAIASTVDVNVPKWGITDETVKLNKGGTGEIMPPLNRNPQPVYPGNHDLPGERSFDINKKINREKLQAEQAQIKMIELMTYQEFLDKLGNGFFVTSLSPQRLVWVVQIYYPNGIDVGNGPLKPGIEIKDTVIDNAQRTKIYDAETGQLISVQDVSLK